MLKLRERKVRPFLHKLGGGISEVLSSQYFRAASDRWRVGLVSLITPSVQEIVIHNAAETRGGRHDSYFFVLNLADRHLKTVFNSLENSDASHPSSEERCSRISRT